MLRSVEITAELAVPARDESFHNLHWQKGLELSLDCFVCRHTRRTTSFQHGQEHALCSADDEHPEHPSPARIAAFDVTNERALSLTPWVRLHLGYYCPQAQESGTFSTQTNLVRPVHDTCAHCTHPLATSKNAPCIRLLT
ncbi:hypothetical protein ABZ387_15355 [Streptomyces flaveolus]|uniref:hypothetical protein n=1 Tax=Streptomyces flaveolus TaxID=67297 RepID=UPI0033DE07FE